MPQFGIGFHCYRYFVQAKVTEVVSAVLLLLCILASRFDVEDEMKKADFTE